MEPIWTKFPRGRNSPVGKNEPGIIISLSPPTLRMRTFPVHILGLCLKKTTRDISAPKITIIDKNNSFFDPLEIPVHSTRIKDLSTVVKTKPTIFQSSHIGEIFSEGEPEHGDLFLDIEFWDLETEYTEISVEFVSSRGRYVLVFNISLSFLLKLINWEWTNISKATGWVVLHYDALKKLSDHLGTIQKSRDDPGKRKLQLLTSLLVSAGIIFQQNMAVDKRVEISITVAIKGAIDGGVGSLLEETQLIDSLREILQHVIREFCLTITTGRSDSASIEASARNFLITNPDMKNII